MMNNNLKGIVIDPGHGGNDSGAVGNNQFEKDFNLKISKYMYDRFKELGIPVTLTREEDITLTPTERVNKILSSYGNDPNVIVISNHLNSGGGTGAEIIYALRNNNELANSILENIGSTGQTTRRTYQRRLPSDTSKDYYFIHRNTGVTEPVIIEYGFIDDTNNNIKFLNDNYKELAEAVIKAVTNYKGIPYTSPKEISNKGIYTIKKGDTLYSIAKKYNTTPDELKKANALTNDILTIGKNLIIPSIDLNETYTIKPGDTLYSIARKYNTTPSELKRINNLTSDILSIGNSLIIPSGNVIQDVTSNKQTYTIKPGDTLYSIAREFNTTAEELKRINNLENNTVVIGKSILVPKSKITETYIVQRGDTLYSIANKFNMNVSKLKEINNLTSNLIQIGQELLLQ